MKLTCNGAHSERTASRWTMEILAIILLLRLVFLLPFTLGREFFKAAREKFKSEAITLLVHLDIFTFSAVKCSYALCSSHTPSTRETCIIIYCFHFEHGGRDEGREGKCFSCFIQGSQRYPISLSYWVHLYLYSYNKTMSTHLQQASRSSKKAKQENNFPVFPIHPSLFPYFDLFESFNC